MSKPCKNYEPYFWMVTLILISLIIMCGAPLTRVTQPRPITCIKIELNISVGNSTSARGLGLGKLSRNLMLPTVHSGAIPFQHQIKQNPMDNPREVMEIMSEVSLRGPAAADPRTPSGRGGGTARRPWCRPGASSSAPWVEGEEASATAKAASRTSFVKTWT